MNHERQSGAARDRDLGLEGPQLVLAGGAVAVVVKPRLADRADGGVGGERLDVGGCGCVEADRRVGMPADAGENIVVSFGGGDRLAVGALLEPDREDPPYAGVARRGDQLGVGRLTDREVRVGVDHANQSAR